MYAYAYLLKPAYFDLCNFRQLPAQKARAVVVFVVLAVYIYFVSWLLAQHFQQNPHVPIGFMKCIIFCCSHTHNDTRSMTVSSFVECARARQPPQHKHKAIKRQPTHTTNHTMKKHWRWRDRDLLQFCCCCSVSLTFCGPI